MRTAIVETLQGVAAAAWNGLSDGANPFVLHEFLAALERTGCVGGDSGWEPHHVLLYAGVGDAELRGAVPLYVKRHSHGEYVFDWTWASAHERMGQAYYPKLVAAVPFTPVTGPRLLVAPGAERDAVAARLIAAVQALALKLEASSVHWLFSDARDTAALEAHGLLRRTGCQFHWSNPGYRAFDDFLATLTAPKRKKIKQERRYVRDAGVTMEVVSGRDARAVHWDTLYRFYRSTIRAHGGTAYLNAEFFEALGVALAAQIVLVFARRAREYVGAALNLRGPTRCMDATGAGTRVSTDCILRPAITRRSSIASPSGWHGSRPAPRASTNSRAALRPRRRTPRTGCGIGSSAAPSRIFWYASAAGSKAT